MEGKITLSLFYMGLISAIIAVALTAVTFFGTLQEQICQDLMVNGNTIAAAYNRSETADLSIFQSDMLRVTLIDRDGRVLFDSVADMEQMENHLERPEIVAALETGSGWATRKSETVGRDDYYYAQRLEDGTVLRVSVPAITLPVMIGQAYPSLIGIIMLLLALAVFFAILLTRRLIRPIKALPAQLDDPTLAGDEKRVYPELAPFVMEIQNQRTMREQMRQEFTANVSHELKTPLTTISGYAEMIETGLAKPEDIPGFAGVIRKEAGRLLSLIADIIRLSQLDEAKEEIRQEPVELLSLAGECAESLTAAANERGIHLEIVGEESTICGNRTQLWELIYNLMDNAIRYNRENGSVLVEIGPRRITVRDTGIGIPPEHQGRVFERFYRVDKSHSRATGGTGLGLSIVKHVAEAHGGKISINSTVNVGTEISVEFEE